MGTEIPKHVGGLAIKLQMEREAIEVYDGPNRIISAGRLVHTARENVTVQWYFPNSKPPLTITPAMVIGAWYRVHIVKQPADNDALLCEFDRMVEDEKP